MNWRNFLFIGLSVSTHSEKECFVLEPYEHVRHIHMCVTIPTFVDSENYIYVVKICMFCICMYMCNKCTYINKEFMIIYNCVC